ncbi:MAG: DEAD/DEAH box helicase [bacterium]
MSKNERPESSLALFHPLIREWFEKRYGTPTDIQQISWPVIAKGGHCLITAPTGGGKTLTAFLWTLNRLITGELPTGVMSVLYISPLKALGSDVRRNLLIPLAELRELFRERDRDFPEIRVLTRSGDTPQNERQKMLRRPPEILITTPESFNILLSSHGGRSLFGHLDTLILDEIHSLVGTKRGVYLIAAVERAAAEWGEFQRIALSATVRPASAVSDFIAGYELHGSAEKPEYRRRPVQLCRSLAEKRYSLEIMAADSASPLLESGPEAADSLWQMIAGRIHQLTRSHNSTLVFANSRRLVEKMARLINEAAGDRIAYAHHGSLSKELRLTVEAKLKKGELRAIVATNSLELGIDVGALDLVVLVQTPFSISSGIQKIGRAGHQVGSVSKGVLFPSHGLDFAKAATLVYKIRRQEIEELKPIKAPLDILAQIILSMAVIRSRKIEELYAQIRGMEPFAELPRRHFDLVIEMLAGKYAGTRIRELQPRLAVDRLEGTVSARKGAQQLLFLSGGTIPDRGQYDMRLADGGSKVGTLDEEFVWERNIGDRFELGTQTWEIKSITHNDVMVSPSSAAPNIIPFWRAEEYNRDFEFSEALLKLLEQAESEDFTERAQQEYSLDTQAAERLFRFLQLQKQNSGAPLPGRYRLIIEHIAEPFGPEGVHRVVIHSLWGGAVNRPFALLLEAFWQKHYGYSPQVIASNDAVLIALPEKVNLAGILARLGAEPLEQLLRSKLEHTGLFGALFRENAGRALLLPRQSFNKRLPLWFNRLRSKKLLSAVYELEDFPILLETWRSCLQDVFDLPHLQQLLDEIASGQIECREFITSSPSPLCDGVVYRQINVYMYADDTPEPSGTSALDEELWGSILDSPDLRPLVEPQTAATFTAKLQRTMPGYAPTEPQEVLEWVKERVLLPKAEWDELLQAIARELEQESAPGLSVRELQASISPKLAWLQDPETGRRFICALEDQSGLEQLHTEVLQQFLRFYGPLSLEAVQERLPYPAESLARTVQELVENGELIHGRLLRESEELQYCDRENLEILLRIQRSARRTAITALPVEQLLPFWAELQGLSPRGSSPDQLAERLDRLSAYPLPADALEKWIIPARMQQYYQGWLDGLSAEEGLGWFGCGRTQLFIAYPEQIELVSDPADADDTESTTPALLPGEHGKYSFFDISTRARLNTTELTDKLWSAVWSQQIANDSFAALRSGVAADFKAAEPGKKRQNSRRRDTGRRHSRRAFREWKSSRPLAGNWYSLHAYSGSDAHDPMEVEELNRARIQLLLDRYGVISRQIVQKELAPFKWSRLLRTLQRMELAGELLGGHFFEGLEGLQFASHAAKQILAADRSPAEDAGVFWLNAADPASPCGLGLKTFPYKLPARSSSAFLVAHGTKIVLTLQRSGKDLHFNCAPDDPHIQEYLQIFDDLCRRDFQPLSRITVLAVNATPVHESEYRRALEAFGFNRSYKGYVYHGKI